MRSLRLFALTLLIAGQAVAQDYAAKAAPCDLHIEIKSPGGYALASTPTLSFTEAPVRHKVIDKKFIFVMGALGGAESLRFTSRKMVLDREFAAGAPWVHHVTPSRDIAITYAGIYASEFLVAYELKKPHSWLPGDKVIRKFWWAYPLAMTALHVKNGLGNIGTQGPGGCTSIECATQIP